MPAVPQRTRLRSTVASLVANVSNYSIPQLRFLDDQVNPKTDICDVGLRDICQKRESTTGDWTEWCVAGEYIDYECDEYRTQKCCCNHFCENDCFAAECAKEGVGGWNTMLYILLGLIGCLCLCALPCYYVWARICPHIYGKRLKKYREYTLEEDELNKKKYDEKVLEEQREKMVEIEQKASHVKLLKPDVNVKDHAARQPSKGSGTQQDSNSSDPNAARPKSSVPRPPRMDRDSHPAMPYAERKARGTIGPDVAQKFGSSASSSSGPAPIVPLPADPNDPDAVRARNLRGTRPTLMGRRLQESSQNDIEAHSGSSSAPSSPLPPAGRPRKPQRLEKAPHPATASIATTNASGSASLASTGETCDELQKPMVQMDTPGKPSIPRRASQEVAERVLSTHSSHRSRSMSPMRNAKNAITFNTRASEKKEREPSTDLDNNREDARGSVQQQRSRSVTSTSPPPNRGQRGRSSSPITPRCRSSSPNPLRGQSQIASTHSSTVTPKDVDPSKMEAKSPIKNETSLDKLILAGTPVRPSRGSLLNAEIPAIPDEGEQVDLRSSAQREKRGTQPRIPKPSKPSRSPSISTSQTSASSRGTSRSLLAKKQSTKLTEESGEGPTDDSKGLVV